jgi:alpha-tubulin suppressor-like RCC1 family protein
MLDEYQNEEFALDMHMREAPIIQKICAGGRHSMVVTNKGRLYTFGYGTHGQLGLKSTSNFSKP